MIARVDAIVRKRLEALARVVLPKDRHILLPSLLPQDHARDERSRHAFEVQYRYSWAGNRYAPQRYRGRAVIYQASDEQKHIVGDPTQGWKNLIDGIDVYVTPGSHFSSITTHAETLAERVRLWLETGEKPSIMRSTSDGR